MNRAGWLQDRRMKKFRDVLSRWERKELWGLEAGELLGVSERQFRRYRDRYEEDGLAGLVVRPLTVIPLHIYAMLLAETLAHFVFYCEAEKPASAPHDAT